MRCFKKTLRSKTSSLSLWIRTSASRAPTDGEKVETRVPYQAIARSQSLIKIQPSWARRLAFTQMCRR